MSTVTPTNASDVQGSTPAKEAAARARALLEGLPGKRILVTGGSGLIGSGLLRHILLYAPADVHVYNLDILDYCAGKDAVLGGLRSMCEFDEAGADIPSMEEMAARYHFCAGSILDSALVMNLLRTHEIDVIVHMAAQTHVNNSFTTSLNFTEVNVIGTHTLLECAREYNGLKRFMHISTDEVYGETSSSGHPAKEDATMMAPTNPYAATKAAAEHLVAAYYRSFKLPILVSRGNNVYGPGQYPEKVIPSFITHVLRNERLPIQGDGRHLRSFLYVKDVARAMCTVLARGTVGQVYNIGNTQEWSVHEVGKLIVAGVKGINAAEIEAMPREAFDAEYVRYLPDRAFNDARYYIDNSRLSALGWTPEVSFEDGLRRTIGWYRAHAFENGGYWQGFNADAPPSL